MHSERCLLVCVLAGDTMVGFDAKEFYIMDDDWSTRPSHQLQEDKIPCMI